MNFKIVGCEEDNYISPMKINEIRAMSIRSWFFPIKMLDG